jgi:hypothetical protein
LHGLDIVSIMGRIRASSEWWQPYVRVVILILFAFASVRGLDAQEVNAKSLCFAPRPVSQCKAFFVFESALVQPLVSSTRPVDYQTSTGLISEYYRANPFGLSFESAAGWMLNLRPRAAAGGIVRVGTGDMGNSHAEWSILSRGRVWLHDRYGFDIQAGAVNHAPGGQFQGPHVWSPTVSARLAHTKWGFVGFRLDLVEVPPANIYTDVQRESVIRDPGGRHTGFLLEGGLSGVLGVAASAVWLLLSGIEISY